MNLYRKNPEIKGTICVQGQVLDDDDVVFGNEFERFADPNTFPGITPRLMRIEFKDLSKGQKEKLKGFEDQLQPKPPKHLGVITTANFRSSDEGVEVAKAKPVSVFPKEEPKTVEKIVEEEEKVPIRIDELFSEAEFIENFHGITEANAKRVLAKFSTIESLAKARNTELRQTGIRSNFFGRVRDCAKGILNELDEN